MTSWLAKQEREQPQEEGSLSVKTKHVRQQATEKTQGGGVENEY